MDNSTVNSELDLAHPHSLPLGEKAKQVILLELERILESSPFRTSTRSKQFLSYVVLNTLTGHVENLKERTIGVEVFQRDPGYATGDDSVVRVNAGEVRRRLEQYYYAAPTDTPVRIEIPLGSYVPEFRWTSEASTEEERPHAPYPQVTHERVHADPENPAAVQPGKSRRWIWLAAASGFALALAAVFIATGYRHQKQTESAADLFWSPVFNSSRPVLICLAQPVVYRPKDELYARYAQSHPGTFQTVYERLDEELPLDPNDKLVWKDIEVSPEFGLATGDVYAGFSIASLLAQKGKASALRIGSNCSFEDLRDSPSVVIGAYNNRWTMQMASNLHFAFQWDIGTQYSPRIKENIPSGRVWISEVGPHFKYSVDYGIVTRLVDSDTGKLLISIGGLRTAGTQAAGELISDPQYLAEALRNAPKDWNKRNVQIVVQTKVTDGIPSPPQVVATYFW
jgi:hypothetical protein